MLTSHTIDLFKVVVAEPTAIVLSNVKDSFITNFNPTTEQLVVLRDKFKGLRVVTLFSVRERETGNVSDLLTKQILHYIEVYGLNTPGLFDLEVEGGKVQTLAFIKAVSLRELETLVHGLLYSNRPVADITPIVEVIRGYSINYDINEVQNNELKVALFDIDKDRFRSGDDAARYICYMATGSSMLIKSKHVVAVVKAKPVSDRFLHTHAMQLARVFNRHKRIIMACKNGATRNTINRISKLSKDHHVPLVEPVAKRLVAGYVRGEIKAQALAQVSLRDKFKYLNLIEWKLQARDYDTFLIRNGKVWFEKDRTVLNPDRLLGLQDAVMGSIRLDLAPLGDKHILLDPSVDYGLPISRKQALGNLPFGTKIRATKRERFSAGVYWHNGTYGSIDLDLSAIDDYGIRTGWGGYRGYTAEDIIFSGDMTDARHGAIEFMTVHLERANRYGLIVNIFRGPEPCDAEIVVGHGNKDDWQDHTIIREKISLASKQSLIGFLKDDAFVIYSGRLSNSRISGGKHPVIDKGLGTLWTVRDILDVCRIPYDVAPQPGVVYDHDLRYESFTQDKLEALLGV